jgi:hypothetical protein
VREETAAIGQPEVGGRRRYLVLAICCISLFIVGIDSTT